MQSTQRLTIQLIAIIVVLGMIGYNVWQQRMITATDAVFLIALPLFAIIFAFQLFRRSRS